MRTRYFPPGARPQVPTGHGAALPGEKHPCPGSPPPPARLPGPGGPEGRGEPRAPRCPHRPGPGGHPRLRSRGQRSPPARRGARPLRLPRGHRPPARRGATGRAGPGVGRPRRCAARGCSAAARPSAPLPAEKPLPAAAGLFLHMGRAGRGVCGAEPIGREPAGPGTAPPTRHPRTAWPRDSIPASPGPGTAPPPLPPGWVLAPGVFGAMRCSPAGKHFAKQGVRSFPRAFQPDSGFATARRSPPAALPHGEKSPLPTALSKTKRLHRNHETTQAVNSYHTT